jgi:soluble lytic murein transglycosylase-like protein
MARRSSLGQTYSTSQIQQMITAAANEYGVPPSVALAFAQVESSFNPNAVNVNPATATHGSTTDYGLFQINSANLASLGISSDPLDVQANINAGVSLLAQYYSEYGGDLTEVAWAYNAGPGSVASGNMPASTANYVASITAAVPSYGSVLPSDSDLTDSDLTDDTSTTGTDFFSSDISVGSFEIPAYALYGGAALLFLGLYAALD